MASKSVILFSSITLISAERELTWGLFVWAAK